MTFAGQCKLSLSIEDSVVECPDEGVVVLVLKHSCNRSQRFECRPVVFYSNVESLQKELYVNNFNAPSTYQETSLVLLSTHILKNLHFYVEWVVILL